MLKDWAIRKAGEVSFLAHPYTTKTLSRWCPHCGKVIKAENRNGIEVFAKAGEEMQCPHCGKPVKVADYRHDYHYSTNERTTHGCSCYKDYITLEEVTTCKGWQIDRIWVADFEFRKGKGAHLIMLASAYERWFNPTIGKEVLLGKYVGAFPYARRLPFSFNCFGNCEGYVHKTLQLRGGASSYYGCASHYCDADAFLYPRVRVLDYFVKRGVNASLLKSGAHGYHDVAVIFRSLNKKVSASFCETIFKQGTTDEVRLMLADERFAKYWASIRVARRHHYDYARYRSEYLDYLEQLDRLDLDLRSPHYVAPDDFRAIHTQMTERIAEMQRREREQAERDRAVAALARKDKEKKDYIARMGKFFGLVITNEDWVATPLKSVDEFYEEGTAMHHCVYSGGYYDEAHKNSLILSVRDSHTDERVVTIELNIKDWQIKQCYTYCDKVHKDDKRIRELIITNIESIKALSKKKPARVSA